MALPPIFPDFTFTSASTSASSPFTSTPYRPAIPSPLSSSPIRATTPTPPPLSPCDANARREIQSSPIPASAAKPTSKFASRPTRPNPVNQKREAAQEGRRKIFLKNVRQRAEDRRWEMRGGEQELLKLEWFSLNKDLRQAKNADLDGAVFESDIEEAARLREEAMSRSTAAIQGAPEPEPGADEMMLDALEQQQLAEFEELEAMAASIPDGLADGQPRWQPQSQKPPDSPYWSDDEDYDELFMDYLSQQQPQQIQAPDPSSEMDLS
ncbi:hypothetical protein VPNG_07723 [Cytospora leucostoma]|uniref:Uncharacterized protein n=1 Tax=Cytospora leucostoma TaxID=1230097 RepID=A0A423W8E1_9PEZI|nr:hypothetical protein VPNG_07723 [Cytospora leucostoma]